MQIEEVARPPDGGFPAIREEHVTASEAAVLFEPTFGRTRWMLHMERAGKLARDDFDENERMLIGRAIEPQVARLWGEKFDATVEPDYVYLYDPKARLGCSPDFKFKRAGQRKMRPLEVKTTNWGTWKDDWLEGADVPFAYKVQGTIQMAMRKAEVMEFAVLIAGQRIERVELPFDKGAFDRIRGEVVDFWQALDHDFPPDPDWNADAPAIKRMLAAAGEEVADLSNDSRALRLVEEIARLTTLKAPYAKMVSGCDAMIDAHKAELLMKMGPAAAAAIPGWEVTAKTIKVRARETAAYAYRKFNIKPAKEGS